MARRAFAGWSVALGLASLGAPVRAQPASFRALGQSYPGALSSFAYGVSGDGSTIVGEIWLTGTDQYAFRWTVAGGVQLLWPSAVARASSFDGSVIVGQAYWPDTQTQSAFRWTAAGGMERVQPMDAMDVSADGNTFVAYALRWTAPGTIDNLGTLGGSYTSAEGVSADGQVAAGWSVTSIPAPFGNLNHAFRWTPSGGMQDLGSVVANRDSLGHAVSGDGGTVVGEARDSNQFWRAFRWTASLRMLDLGTLGGPMSAAYDASTGGTVIVGKSLTTSSSASERAFRWTSGTGMRDLRQQLLGAGVTAVQNWFLMTANGVSADGTVIGGSGLNPSLGSEAWIAVLGTGPLCYANCDGSTAAPVLNVNDFSCFLNRFAAGDSYANCDGSTSPPVLNVNDFACFLNRFAAGCS